MLIDPRNGFIAFEDPGKDGGDIDILVVRGNSREHPEQYNAGDIAEAKIVSIVMPHGAFAEIIPGVTSFSACAAKLGTALCEGPERLLVAPVMASDVDDILDVPANKVFMKSGKAVHELRDKLAARGQLEGASMVANCGLPDEKVFAHFADIDDDGDYFSVVIVKNS